ncbi:DUF4235 domain-containing protein [Streptomyces sp. NPDC060194]|uniref:DUF4235 domain-containing protein n=1 Tax=Streptomyces sp. NPDC060194 TaxID=3347069 RepID=UPI0036639A34
MAKKKSAKLPLAYKPVGFALGWAGGAVAAALFQQAWKAIRNEDDAPDALDRDRGWGEVLLAATVQGAIFGLVRGAVDRSGAAIVQKATGTWPGDGDGRD